MLKLNGISTHYGDVQALREVSFTIQEGEVVSIIGSNGAGKSTTLNTISVILRASSGSIEFLGRRIENHPPHEIVAQGVVQIPEGRLLFPYMSVLENLELGAFNGKARMAKGESIQTDHSDVERRFDIDFIRYFAAELEALREHEQNGFLRLGDAAISVTRVGRVFIRNIAMTFDKYLEDKSTEKTFSRTI